MKHLFRLLILCTVCNLLLSCGGNNNTEENTEKKQEKTYEKTIQKSESSHEYNFTDTVNIALDSTKAYLRPYYHIPHIREFYTECMSNNLKEVKPFNYDIDLTSVTYDSLKLLRNEIFARNGHLFSDGFLRGHFNKYSWYLPIYGVDSFKVQLSEQEEAFINAVLEEEAKRKAKATININGLNLYNSDLIVNRRQFKAVHEEMNTSFKNQNFCILNANRALPFYTYDENAYQYIPHYITTDLYLFILHKYFSTLIEKLDERYMYKTLNEILKGTSKELSSLKTNNNSNAIKWAQTYNAIGLYALGHTSESVPEAYKDVFETEKKQIKNLNGKAKFIANSLVSYSELTPRGHYSKNDTLKKYFKAFKWMSLNGIDIDNDTELKGLLTFGYALKNNSKLYRKYQTYTNIIEKLAGVEDNLSLKDLIEHMPNGDIDDVLSENHILELRKKLSSSNKERIKMVFGESFQTKEKTTQRLFFLSSTYSISGEIFSKLVHVDGSESKRPFPRGLDIPAVFGNPTAHRIIKQEYKDAENWPQYHTRFKELKAQFTGFNEWDHNYGFKGLQTALSACSESEDYPDYMKTGAYNRKELSTMLASWTHIKHDLILYQEKPCAAECGQCGGPEPPKHYSYVEPNIKFWATANELVVWLEKLSKYENSHNDELRKIKHLGLLLENVALKQIKGEAISDETYKELHFIGGTIEYILLGLLETDHIPDREKSMALIADVYKLNSTNLNVAVGHADDIYTIVPIKGEYYIARGSVFSYYEFKGDIHTDEKWRQRINKKDIPDRPEWIDLWIDDLPELKGNMVYRNTIY